MEVGLLRVSKRFNQDKELLVTNIDTHFRFIDTILQFIIRRVFGIFQRVYRTDKLVPLLEKVAESGKPLLVIADDVEGDSR